MASWWKALGFAVLWSAPVNAAPPRRIVSLNACADAYIVALADPGQIAALTQFARDPHYSTVLAQAARLPVSNGSAEEVIALKPDLIVASSALRFTTMAALAGHGVPIIDLPDKDDLAGIEAMIGRVAAAVGHPDRGRALVDSIEARLAAIGAPPGRGRIAADYQRRGYMTGTGTLIDEMMGRVGLVNLAGKLGRPVLSQLSLEEMAMAHPDFLLLESDTRTVSDRSTEALHHPLLDRVVPPAHRLYFPQALTVCGGPSYPEAVNLLANEIRAADTAAR
jgi:iron complex transport system substrate-binding protein